jgi:hypothetical protein
LFNYSERVPCETSVVGSKPTENSKEIEHNEQLEFMHLQSLPRRRLRLRLPERRDRSDRTLRLRTRLPVRPGMLLQEVEALD